MPPSPRFQKPVDVTSLDFDQTFSRLVELAGSLYPWLDLDTRAEIARLHLEGLAHIGEHFHFYLNRLGRESRWGTAQERSHLLAQLKLIGYRPATATAAHTEERFTLSAPAAAPVTFPIGTVVHTPDAINPIRFQLIEEVVIPIGQTIGLGQVEHSTTHTEVYVSETIAFQRIRLAEKGYLDGTLSVATALGAWTEVTNFLDSGPNDRHFMTTVDSQDRVTVTFGNNRSGAIPTGLRTFIYKTGGGAVGRLPENALSEIDGLFTDSNGTSVSVTVTNPSPSLDGNDRESEAMIKLAAPAQIEVLGRAVSRTDYERLALKVPDVAFALMLTRNESDAVQENEGFLYVVPTDGSVASTALLEEVASRFGDAVAVGSGGVYVTLPEGPTPKTTTFQLRVRAAVYKEIRLFVKAFLRKGARPEVVGPAIEAAFAGHFAIMVDAEDAGLDAQGLIPNPRINFGYYLQDVDGVPTGHFPISDVETLVAGVTGVRELGDGPTDLLLNDAARNVSLERYEFPRPGAVTLILA